MIDTKTKPLGHKSYGSIGHLPGSRMEVNHQKHGTGRIVGKDFGVHPGAAAICTKKARDKYDRIIVQEKLDGSNVSVANIDGVLVALGRAGHTAVSSPYEQHRMFAQWVIDNYDKFIWLAPGERCCGEWLAQAHGTRYKLQHAPFVVFDIMRNGHERALWDELYERVSGKLPLPELLSVGPPCSIDDAMKLLGDFGHHGAIDPVEGAVWRVERQGKVDFLAKFVRSDKQDGKYLPEMSGGEPIWNWKTSP